MKIKVKITFIRLFKPNYYLIRTTKQHNKMNALKEAFKFAFFKHLLKIRCMFFTLKVLQ